MWDSFKQCCKMLTYPNGSTYITKARIHLFWLDKGSSSVFSQRLLCLQIYFLTIVLGRLKIHSLLSHLNLGVSSISVSHSLACCGRQKANRSPLVNLGTTHSYIQMFHESFDKTSDKLQPERSTYNLILKVTYLDAYMEG